MSFNFTENTVLQPLPLLVNKNSIAHMAQRAGGRLVEITGVLNANNTSETINLFKITGSVNVTNAYAEIIDATTLTNCTACYFDAYDGTVAIDITANGAVLSGATAGSLIIKNKVSTEIALVINADQVRYTESDASKRSHQHFIITQKNGVDTFIRAHYTTTDTPINAIITFYVVYQSFDGGCIEPAV